MDSILQAMDFWHWWTIAIIFLVLEALVSGFYLAWLAVSAFIIGIIIFLNPGIYWQQQWLMFGTISIISLVGWFYFGPKNNSEDSNGLNRRAEQYVNRVVHLETAIENGFGRIRLDDTLWRVAGPDLPQGSQVQITKVDAGQLIVSPVKK